MYYLYGENKGADQLRDNGEYENADQLCVFRAADRTADLRLCFQICKNSFFMMWLRGNTMNMYLQIVFSYGDFMVFQCTNRKWDVC